MTQPLQPMARKCINKSFRLSATWFQLLIVQKPQAKNLGNQIALLMHFRVMGHSGQVAMDSCHGQVFF